MRWLRWLLLLGLAAAAATAQTLLPPCPGEDATIEAVPLHCAGQLGGPDRYPDYRWVPGCALPDPYPGHEAVLRLRLHEGNRLRFFLTPQAGADLVLVLLREDTGTCAAHSLDNLGSAAEEIASQSYPPGYYQLLVDSVDMGEPSFELAIDGTNPLPDLALELRPASLRWVPGTDVEVALEVTNHGTGTAHEVEIAMPRPRGVRLVPPPAGCTADAEAVRCRLGTLAAGATTRRSLLFHLDPRERGENGRVVLSAQVSADELDPDLASNLAREVVRIEPQADLEVTRLQAFPERRWGLNDDGRAVAGLEIGYWVRVRNHGPSSAEAASVELALPPGLDPLAAPPGCSMAEVGAGLRLRCDFGALQPNVQRQRRWRLRVRPETRGRVVPGRFFPQLEVAATTISTAGEPDPKPLDNARALSTPISAETALTFSGLGSPSPVVAGERLVYALQASNAGPSTALGATIELDLPTSASFVAPDHAVTDDCAADGDVPGRVRCMVDVPPAGAVTALIAAQVDPSKTGDLAAEGRLSPVEGEHQHGPLDALTLVNRVDVVADLGLEASADPSPVVVGESTVLSLRVTNRGPSTAPSGTSTTTLPAGLFLAASPDRCELATSGDSRAVDCTYPDLRPGAARRFRLVLGVQATESAAAVSVASSLPADHEPGDNQRTVALALERRADLAVALSGSPPVLASGEVTYQATVTNLGPSMSGEAILHLCLPPGSQLSPSSCDPQLTALSCQAPSPLAGRDGFPECAQGNRLDCAVGPLAVGKAACAKVSAVLSAEASTLPFPLMARAELEPGDGVPDLDPANDRATAATLIAGSDAADLAVSLAASADPVVVGDTLTYTLTVTNHGPGGSGEATACLKLPPGLAVLAAAGCDASATGCPQASSSTVSCALDLHARGEGATRTISTTVCGLEPPGTSSLLKATASVSPAQDPTVPDPDNGNDATAVETRVLDLAPLVLPWFRSTDTEAAYLALRNDSEEVVTADLDFRPSGGGGQCAALEVTLAIRGLAAGALSCPTPAEGSVEIGGALPAAVRPALSGAFFPQTAASLTAQRLTRTTSNVQPRELCRRWAVPLLQGLGVQATTDYAFFLAEASEEGEPEIVGRLYNAAGWRVQLVRVPATSAAFELSSRDDLDLLASAGWIEWTLPQVGSVSATFRQGGADAAGVPGICLDPTPVSSRWVVPRFEALNSPGSPTGYPLLLLFNPATTAAGAEVALFSPPGEPLCGSASSSGTACPAVSLEPQGSTIVNLAAILDGLTSAERVGFAEVRPAEGGQLVGVYLQLDTTGRLSGEALVAAGDRAAGEVNELCTRWSLPLFSNWPSPPEDEVIASTALQIYCEGGNQASCAATITAYNAGGESCSTLTAAALRSQQIEPSGKALQGCAAAGSVEVSFPNGAVGHVSALYLDAAGRAALAAGTCLDAE